MDIDCCMQTGGKWFRYRAAAIIIENGCVLFAHNESDDYYYSVGGGVHMGETAEQAVEREVFEETGIHYEIDRLAFIHENFFDGSGTLSCTRWNISFRHSWHDNSSTALSIVLPTLLLLYIERVLYHCLRTRTAPVP